MKMTLEELVRQIGGRLCGNGDTIITGAATLAEAKPGEISLADDRRRAGELARSAAAAVITPEDFTPEGISCIQVSNVHEAFAAVVQLFRPPRPRQFLGVSPQAFVSPTARIGDGVEIHPGAAVADEVEIDSGCVIHAGACLMAGCRLGRDVVVFPNAVLCEDTVVGDRTIIHAGAVVGAHRLHSEAVDDHNRRDGRPGYVRIENDVDIGAGTVIERGRWGATIIGEGTKLDDQVMIGPNCRIGPHNIFCAQVGTGGSVSTGRYVVMAGQAGVRDQVHIGDLAMVGPQAGAKDDLPPGGRYLGTPARPEREIALLWSSLAKLPELRKQVKTLWQEIERLRSGGAPAKNAA
jgi:UDP-3-O-[3-hydroxymyristoyl] glucosamine N-acyltransferase